MFYQYLQLGFHHILDLTAYDHLAYIVVLASAVPIHKYKRLLGLITAFTIGHSLSLIASTRDWINVNMDWIEFLIPVTIMLSAIYNILPQRFKNNLTLNRSTNQGTDNEVDSTSQLPLIIMVSFFGLIHGMGFSNYLKEIFKMAEESPVIALFGFNVGIELAQIAIIIPYIFVGFLIFRLFPSLPKKYWIYPGSIIGLLLSIYLMIS